MCRESAGVATNITNAVPEYSCTTVIPCIFAVLDMVAGLNFPGHAGSM